MLRHQGKKMTISERSLLGVGVSSPCSLEGDGNERLSENVLENAGAETSVFVQTLAIGGDLLVQKKV
jgi:hypothetical protein